MTVPMGTANSIAITVIVSVPEISGRMPYCGFSKSGVQTVPVMKSHTETKLKKPIDS